MRLLQWGGIGLVGVGVLWESLLAPSLIGWGFILSGFAALLLSERRWPRRTPLDGPLLLLIVMGCVSLLVTASPQVTQIQVMRLGAGLAGFYGLVNWARDRARLLQAAALLMVGGVGLALLAPFVVGWNLTKSMLIPSSIYEPFSLRVSDPVHPNIMAALMILLLPLPLAWLLSPDNVGPRWKRIGRRFALGAACLLMGAILLLTKSRGGYIAGAVGGLMVVWLSARKRRSLVPLFLTLTVIGVGAWWLFRTESQAPELVEGAVDPSTWAFRQRVWRAALQMLTDFSFTGVGMGLFNDVASLLYAFQAPQNPGAHNLYLQVGVDLGFPGLIAYLAVLMSTLWMAGASLKAFAQQRDGALRTVTVGAFAGTVALVVHGLVDIAVWGTRAAFIPWVVIGLVVGLHRVAEEPERGRGKDDGEEEAVDRL
jgi:putative inorganic carbon (HCO3(-)) transporter